MAQILSRFSIQWLLPVHQVAAVAGVLRVGVDRVGDGAVAVDFLRKGTADLDNVTIENLLERI